MRACIMFFQLMLLTCGATQASSIPIPENQITSSASDAIVSIINQFYNGSSISVNCGAAAGANKNQRRQSDFIDATLDRLNTFSATIEDLNVLETATRSVYNLIFTNDYSQFEEIFQKIQRGKFKYNGFYTIVLTKADQDTADLYEITTKILQDCWTKYIVNVVIVWPSLSTQIDETDIYTYFPYTPYHCERVHPVLLDQYHNGSFLMNQQLFPIKLNNMYLCPLTISSILFYPYIHEVRDQTGGKRFDGLDVQVVDALANHLNFTYTIKIPTDPTERGVIMKNKTVTGILGMVNCDDALYCLHIC